MSSYGTPIYWDNYPNNSNVQHVYMSNYPNNSNVMTVWVSSYPNNSGVMHAYQSNYPNNSNVQHIYLSGCFPKSELVQTKFGEYAPIGALKSGNKIATWNTEQNKMQYTAVTGIHKYTVNDIICLNKAMRVSSSHPLMVIENDSNGVITPKWKVAFDVNAGDYVVGNDGKLIVIETKSRHWYNKGIEVLNLSTDDGVPFLTGGCVVRAENAQDSIKWVDSPLTKKFLAA